MNTWISEQYYGQWYYNAAVIIFVCHLSYISLQRAIAFILLLLLTIKQGRICDTLYDPLQPWLRLALHSFGLV